MSRLIWGTPGQRFYETGVDRGVLFIDNIGVAWNGLKTVSETSSGGSAKPLYIDGQKYLNLSESEEFQATIEAFSAPSEFKRCDGEIEAYAGLSLTQQPRKTFGLSYRTLVGNDVLDTDLGYKIHIVYNALSSPSQRSRSSVNDSPDPLSLSWALTTTPPSTPGYKPTSHLIIDSRTTPSVILAQIEDLLYGTDTTISVLPSISEILTIFSTPWLSVESYDDSEYVIDGTAVEILSEGFAVEHASVTDVGDGTFTIE